MFFSKKFKNIIFLFLTISLVVYIYFPKISHAYTSIGPWLSNKAFDNNIASHYSFIHGNSIYAIGGANSATINSGGYSAIDSNGKLTNWSGLTNKPNLYWHSGAVNNNFIFTLGGANNNRINVSSVYVANIEIDGDITNWNETTPLPLPLTLGGSFIYNNRIYYAGGSTNGESSSSARSEIYKAEINSDGTLGPWILAGNLPRKMLGFGLIEDNGYLVVMGGKSTNDIYLAEVHVAKINSQTGMIETWVQEDPLPDPAYRSGVTKFQNTIISIGGYNVTPSFNLMDKVNYAEIGNNGNILTWSTSPYALIQPNCCMSLVTWHNFIYEIGGWVGHYTNEVNTAQVDLTIIPIPTNTPSPTPVPTPSPVPTIPPTPTPLIPIMGVSNLKQYEGGWENDIYGHTDKTIGQWGCALTSASMVLNYHGHKILPNELNRWLKSQPDGFIRNGLINWLAISRYTKENHSPTSRTLEYKRLPVDNLKLDSELLSNQPAILKEDGHFIVATGKRHDEIYTINDPGYSNKTLLSDYSNNYLAINSYTPTDSDLSYMMFIANENIVLELIDKNGNTVQTQNFIEQPIKDINDSQSVSGSSLSVLLYSKPDSGKYKLKITGVGSYNLDAYLYDINGEVIQKTFSGKLFGSDYDIYDLTFNSSRNVKLSTEGIMEKLKSALNNNQIKNKGIYTAVKIHLEIFDRINSDKIITLLIKQIENLTPKLINQSFSTTLQLYLRNLIK